MPRLGELLVAAGLLTIEQVEQALRAQVVWGGRLGTNLVELHHLELDTLSSMLGRQHRLPAALASHFEKADPQLQRMLPPELAERFSCVPLLRMGPNRHVVIASIAPLRLRQLMIIAHELAVDLDRLVPAIAAELRIRYQLERVYQIRRAARFMRARGETVPPFPAFQVLQVEPEPEPEPWLQLPTSTAEMEAYRPELDELAPPPPHPATPPAAQTEFDDSITEVLSPTTTAEFDHLSLQAQLDDEPAPETGAPREVEAAGRERRTYLPTIADAPGDTEQQAMLGRIAIRKVAVGSAPRIVAGATLREAIRAIRRASGRDRVADLVVDTLERFAPACEAAILLVIRGATAIGWKGFQRGGGALGEIAVPMQRGSLVPAVVQHNIAMRKPAGELGELDRLLLTWLGRHTGDLVIVPIAVAAQVLCVMAIATAEDAPLESAEPIAAAAAAAFARLMRDASR